MMWVVVLLISAIAVLAYFRHKLKYKDMNKLPGPPVKLFIGNAMEFGSTSTDVFENIQRLIKTYGRLVRVWFGPLRLTLFITEPDMVEFFLTKCDCTVKSTNFVFLKLLFGEGLAITDGENWRKFRRTLTPAFQFKILEKFPDTFHRNMQVLVDKFKEENGKTVDVCKPIRHYAIDVLCETSMGTSFNCQINGDNLYVKSLEGFLDIFIRRFFSFFKNFDLIFKHTRDYTKANKYINTIHSITKEIIEKRKEERCNSTDDDDDSNKANFGIRNRKVFMDILLDYPGLSDEEIRCQVDTFLMAGHHTVSAIIAMSLYELAKHSKVQQNILDEIHNTVGTDRTTVIQLPELKKMRYLNRVVKELLRLYPPVPFFVRELTADVVYEGMKIPANTGLMFQPYAQHRDPVLFPDPEKFDPDRFLPGNTRGRHPFSYIPFGAGPRNCIGMGFAMIEIETTLANTIRHFEIFPADFPHTPIIASDSVLKFMNGLPVKLFYRE